MKGRRLFRYLAAVSGLACLACGDYASPTSPLERKEISPAAPTGAAYSRWMLISGVWVCVDKCDDNRQATSGIDLHFTPPDSLR
jgi:hypothetical protein